MIGAAAPVKLNPPQVHRSARLGYSLAVNLAVMIFIERSWLLRRSDHSCIAIR